MSKYIHTRYPETSPFKAQNITNHNALEALVVEAISTSVRQGDK